MQDKKIRLTAKSEDTMERWIDIKGYEGLYQISTFGRVFSIERKVKTKFGTRTCKPKELKPFRLKTGYLVIELSNTSRKKFLLHRLVAENFIENPLNKPCVNHIDGDKSNNSLKNLEWVTAKENSEHAIAKGLSDTSGENHGSSKLTFDQVLQIRNGFFDLTHKQIAEKFGVNKSRISSIRTNRSWKK